MSGTWTPGSGSTSGADTYTGTSGADASGNAGLGRDTLDGAAGNDTLQGGFGTDSLAGGEGNDLLLGQDEADTLLGGEGDDTLDGGLGADSIGGGGGDDLLLGGVGKTFADLRAAIAANPSPATTGTVLTNSEILGGSGLGLTAFGAMDGRGAPGSGNDGWVMRVRNQTNSDGTLTIRTGSTTWTTFTLTAHTEALVYLPVAAETPGVPASVTYTATLDAPQGGAVEFSRTTSSGGAIWNGSGPLDPSSDTLDGGDGNDSLTGGAGNDSLAGGVGNDVVGGGADADVLSGGDGNDTLDGGLGADTIEGGLAAAGLTGGGQGGDTVSYAGASGAVTVDLAAGVATGAAGTDALAGFTGIVGSGFGDSLTGDAGDNTIQGGAGDDTIQGGGGTDTVIFAGARAGYTITEGSDANGGYVLVQDTDPGDGDDGTDRVYAAETLLFADESVPVCFMPGTDILTPTGEVAVETLRPGDLVVTAEGDLLPVRWIGRQTVATGFADPLVVNPIRIRAGALADNVPTRDLLVSPGHALLVGGMLVHAGALVNGLSILREAPPAEVFVYLHVELPEHRLLLAHGTPAESFVDNVERGRFDNWDAHEARRDETPVTEMDLPRAKSHRQVPPALRAALAGRAEVLFGLPTAAAA